MHLYIGRRKGNVLTLRYSILLITFSRPGRPPLRAASRTARRAPVKTFCSAGGGPTAGRGAAMPIGVAASPSALRRIPRAHARENAPGHGNPLNNTAFVWPNSGCLASSAWRSADWPARPIRLKLTTTLHPEPALGSAAASAFAPESPTSQVTMTTVSCGGRLPVASAAATASAPASPIGMLKQVSSRSPGATPRRKTPQSACIPSAPKRLATTSRRSSAGSDPYRESVHPELGRVVEARANLARERAEVEVQVALLELRTAYRTRGRPRAGCRP